MKRNQLLIIGLLGLAIIASACTDNTGKTTSSAVNAVQVTNFTAFPSPAYDTQPVSLQIRLENTGKTKVKNPEVKLFNLVMGGNLEKGEWGVQSGVSPDGTVKNLPKTIRPANPDQNIPARPIQKQVMLLPPDLSQNSQRTYTIGGRVSYGYKTTATSEIQLMGNQRFLEKRVAKTEPATDNSAGPIKMDLKTSTPIVFYNRGGGITAGRKLCIVVSNKGSGNVVPPEESLTQDTQGKLVVEIQSPGLNYNSTMENPGDNQVTAKLIGNSRRVCFNIGGLDSMFNSEDIQKTVPITMTARYRYVKEDQTTVTINGRQGKSGLTPTN